MAAGEFWTLCRDLVSVSPCFWLCSLFIRLLPYLPRTQTHCRFLSTSSSVSFLSLSLSLSPSLLSLLSPQFHLYTEAIPPCIHPHQVMIPLSALINGLGLSAASTRWAAVIDWMFWTACLSLCEQHFSWLALSATLLQSATQHCLSLKQGAACVRLASINHGFQSG